MKKTILTIAICAFLTNLYGQSIPAQTISVGLSAGNSDKLTLFNIPIIYHHEIKQIQGLRYSLGIRQNIAFGQRKFTLNNQSTTIDDISSYSINMMVGLEYISKYKFLVGFTIDAFGGNFGTRSFKTVGTDPVYAIKPEYTNVLLGGSNDKGTLNSEYYVGYRFNDNITLKAGLAHYLISLEYANSKGKGRIQSFSNLPFIQVQYSLWQR